MNKEISIAAFEQHISLKTKNYTFMFIKRTFDVLIALIGCLCLMPIIVIVKILYLLNKDSNKIFYSQKRIGKNGVEFKLYKFRTMVPNADKKLEEILRTNKKLKEEWQQNHKFTDDPRITKIGNILRKLSLDELPQFINILNGDMSLIGPRPLIKGELDIHNGNHQIYESVRPGITGWWACNGRSDLTYDERLKLEYYYVQNKSLLLDIKCIFKTILVVIKKEGAK